MSVSYGCCVLSGTGHCVGLITRPEESYRMWSIRLSVIVNPRIQEALAHKGCCFIGEKIFWVTLL
jgi:hypothetical protein